MQVQGCYESNRPEKLRVLVTRESRGEHTMAANPYKFTLPPNETLNIYVTFSSFQENAMTLTDLSHQLNLFGCNNYTSDPRTFSYTNRTGAAIYCWIHAGHKHTPPNAKEDWHDSY